jgi:hypothetical protein
MRESVPHPPRSRIRNLLRFAALAPVLALTFALGGCSGETKGQVILALQTDMSLPEDISLVKIKVKAGGATRHDGTYIVDPNQDPFEQLPATLAVVAGEKDNETVELTVTAFRSATGGGFEARTLNKTVTTIPTERVATLHVPMQWLCTDSVEPDDDEEGEFKSSCPEQNGKERACVAGACKDVHVNSADLPNFNPDDIFGGSEEGSDGTCFPTEECFDEGEDLVPDSDCVVTFDPASDEILNFAALATTGGIGNCRSTGGSPCYVGLDKSQTAGWYELPSDEGGSGDTSGEGPSPPNEAPLGRRFQLPMKVCERMNLDTPTVVGVRASTSESCLVTKTAKYPTCGPWSSVGKKEQPPDDEDSDGDGVPASEDCDDDDNTVYPGALEACDELDNDCNDEIDDDCVENLPFSHRVDFSELDGFTSSENYAIYQEFDAAKPLDLDGTTVTFTPGSEYTHYLVRAGSLDWETDVGELVPVTGEQDPSDCDDCFTSLPLEFPFNFYGTEYTTVFPSSNGYLTFGAGDDDFTVDLGEFLGTLPRIAAFWNDLDSSGPTDTIADEIRFFSSSSKLVVTYQNIQLFTADGPSGTTNTFQFVLLDDGTIKVSYDGMTDRDEYSLAGVTPGADDDVQCDPPLTACNGSCVDLETDLFNCGECSAFCSSGNCVDGICEATPCFAPYVACGDECVDIQSDIDHCGACDSPCGSGTCFNGLCPGDTYCQVGNLPCGGYCSGICEFDSPAVCDGTCIGTCTGTCSQEDADGACQGVCDGECLGQCYLTGIAQCDGACSGVCYVDSNAECPDPTAGAPGPCSFTTVGIGEPTTCYDAAEAADSTVSYYVSCGGTTCQCQKSSEDSYVTLILEATPETACVSQDAVRRVLLEECMPNSPCGDGCPATQPAARAACDETEIFECTYPTAPTYCMCMGGTYICQ